MKRRQAAPPNKKSPPICCDPGFAGEYPALAAHLTDLWWDDGKAREPGTLTVRMSGDEVFLSLSEPDDKSSAYTAGPTLANALALLNDALARGAVKFKAWKR
jgi:hypothetical protein